ncbi:MAG: hypothetical protein GY714_08490 [Desulfobacterales bacterium]|nr:hypothetical protein [Desulfobacterales bacterium]
MNIVNGLKKTFFDTVNTCKELFIIIIPISIITRFLDIFGLIEYIGVFLSPVMGIVGLPGSMGIVWATAMITNMYAGIIVFAALAPQAGLTVAQVTVLATMILVAHSLPIEIRISQKAGPRLRFIAPLRIFGALLIGFLLNKSYEMFNYLQEPNQALWTPAAKDSSWIGWAKGEINNFIWIFLIIITLLLTMKILDKIGVIDLLKKLLTPVLTILGMSSAALPITMIGMTLGIGYGGGLIIQEAKNGEMTKFDIFYSLALMSLCHSLVEDTLLMVVIGGHISGIIWGRILFTFVAIYILGKIMRKVPDSIFNKHFFRV